MQFTSDLEMTAHDTERYDPIRDILSKPEGEQLDYAIELLRWYGATNTGEMTTYWRRAFSLSKTQARLFQALYSRMPDLVTFEHLTNIMGSEAEDPNGYLLKTQIHHLRKKMPRGVKVVSEFGVGYSLQDKSGKLPRPGSTPKCIATPSPTFLGWDKEEDDLLERLIRRNTPLTLIAVALERSPRSITDRIKVLRKAGRSLPPIWR